MPDNVDKTKQTQVVGDVYVIRTLEQTCADTFGTGNNGQGANMEMMHDNT